MRLCRGDRRHHRDDGWRRVHSSRRDSLFVETLVQSGADFAKGSRFIPGGGSHDITSFRRAGNRGLNLLVNMLCSTRYTDLCYGYNAFWRRCLPVFALEHGRSEMTPGSAGMHWGDGFEIETIINIRSAGASLQVVEVPSFEHSRLHGHSNLHAFSDGLRVLRTIFAEWRRRHVSDIEARVDMGTILDFNAPRLDREALMVRGTELEYCGVADRSS